MYLALNSFCFSFFFLFFSSPDLILIPLDIVHSPLRKKKEMRETNFNRIAQDRTMENFQNKNKLVGSHPPPEIQTWSFSFATSRPLPLVVNSMYRSVTAKERARTSRVHAPSRPKQKKTPRVTLLALFFDSRGRGGGGGDVTTGSRGEAKPE